RLVGAQKAVHRAWIEAELPGQVDGEGLVRRKIVLVALPERGVHRRRQSRPPDQARLVRVTRRPEDLDGTLRQPDRAISFQQVERAKGGNRLMAAAAFRRIPPIPDSDVHLNVAVLLV